MSRHVIDGTDSIIVVGWDNSMRTFFYQVYDTRKIQDDEDTPDLQGGYEYGEWDIAEPMLDFMIEKCEEAGIPVPPDYDRDDLLRKIDADRGSSRPRTTHQMAVEKILTGEDPPELRS